MDIVKLHQLIDQWAAGERAKLGLETSALATAEIPERELPEGQRAVRTKTSGDRVYLLDDKKKTRQWVTTPEILKALGFEPGDVIDVDDNVLMKYQMGPALYKLPDETA